MKYEEYKDSGVQWIGEVPKHWGICRLKNYCSLKARIGWKGLRSEEFEEESYAYLVTGQDFGNSKIDWAKCYQINKKRYNEDPYIQLENGDLLITKDGTIGKVAIVDNLDKPACLNSGVFVLKQIKNKYDTNYLYWTLYSTLLKDFNIYTSSGTTILHLYQNVFEEMPLIIPPLIEQQAIATYLDEKCGEINHAIDIQKKKIDLLNELKQTIITDAVTKGLDSNATMKDSGVEWIGEIPEHWEVMKLNFACKKITDFVASGSFADLRNNVTYLDEPDYAMLVRTADLSGKDKATAKVYVSKHSYKFLSNSNLFGGEVILPNIGASIGDVYIVPEHIYEKATLGPNSIMLISKTDNNFLYYLFRSKRWREALIILGQAAAQGKFNKTEVRGLKVIIPPITEQQTIVAHIEKKVSKIDLQISKANRHIELLEELKQSIITEAVTGKIKVC